MTTRQTIRAALVAAILVTVAGALAAGTLEEIEKFYRPTDAVATAAQPTIPQLAAVRDAGFKTIVNLRESGEFDAAAEEKAAADLGFRYVSIPVKTADPRSEQLDAFLKALSDAGAYPVFIHCGSGNRVGAFWMVRRVLVDGWSLEDAEKEARRIGMKSPNLREFALESIRARRSP